MTLYFVELRVGDWAASVAFYRDVLRLRPILSDEAGAFALFEVGGGRVAVKAGEPRPGGVLLAMQVDDLDGWLSRLGALVEGPPQTSAEGDRPRSR